MFDFGSLMGGGGPSTVVPGLGEMFKQTPSLMERFGGWMDKNPEQVWMALDQAGKAIAPENPMAGIGTQVSQAKLMHQQQVADDAKQNSMLGMLSDAMSGKMTAKDMKGPTSYGMTMNPDGTQKHSFDINPNGNDITMPQYSLGGGGNPQ